MAEVISSITVMFDEPFWVAIYERQFGSKYEACKITFGAEPKDYEVYAFLLKNYNHLKFSPAIKARVLTDKYVNPKRMQRLINKQLNSIGAGTKAQQAFKLMQEQSKQIRKASSRQKRDEEKERKFELKSAKRKEKHKGH
ncbi:MAG: YjdF family protein [Eubacterium sp.]|nr:YjdF family protein [Eubacterium sp.]